jgi:cation transport regulator ChaC
MHYFAYGSNMSSARLRRRVPSAVPVGRARLPAYRLCFRKRGRDGSAKCDIHTASDAGAAVWGVVYRIHPDEKPHLDAAEDLHRGYAIREVEVRLSPDRQIRAFTYYALQTDHRLQPFAWYREHVLRGAREHALPADYVAMIERIPSIDDPDPGRHCAELQLYAGETGVCR